MSKFIKVITLPHNEMTMINIDQISVIWETANTILMSGTHGEENGLLHITSVSMTALINKINREDLI